MKKPVRVLLADDHPLVRAGVAATFASEPHMLLVGEATDGFSAQQMCRELQPDVLLLDLNMPGPSPFETLAFLKARCPHTKIVVLTAYDDMVYVRRMVTLGVSGYLLKEEALEVIGQAIRTVMKGGRWLSEPILMKLVTSQGDTEPVAARVSLTPRESELLYLVALGQSDHEIGKAMGIADRTVRHHLRHIYDRLSVNSRVEAVVRALRLGLIESP